MSLINVGAIPSDAAITAYDYLATGDQSLSFSVAVALPGGLTVRPGDVVRFNGTTYSLAFDATANGIPNGVMTDVLAEISPPPGQRTRCGGRVRQSASFVDNTARSACT